MDVTKAYEHGFSLGCILNGTPCDYVLSLASQATRAVVFNRGYAKTSWGVRRLYNMYNLHYVPTTLGVQS
jgi:hypothetical protein